MERPLLSPFSPNLPYSAKERWVCVYPAYLNNRRTRAQGRKLSVENCVDNPKHSEVTMILGKLSLDYLLETKVHPKERDAFEPMNKWRVRVHLKNDDGSPVNEQFPNRQSLLSYLGKALPVVRSRRPATSSSSTTEQTFQGKKNKRKRK
ncbi:unnamed protein product [Schistosoma margrebowiei]|uniref:Signal recognition particle 19 kDa protein n=1 Tax=Schistosoma margrebowiei TaxID=48269 RepID=A0A183NB72_9TREM|nr:unnamed protein product [Schistosoma margrebowiei]VDP55570.1 unnamed protein product [Schistosoma margrebowiei]